jgi:hypothetical protein
MGRASRCAGCRKLRQMLTRNLHAGMPSNARGLLAAKLAQGKRREHDHASSVVAIPTVKSEADRQTRDRAVHHQVTF